MYLSGLAAVLVGVVFGVLWQGSTPAWAEVVAKVSKLNSVRVEGWFLPLDGMDIIVHPPSDDDDPSKGFESQASSTVGAITRHEFHRTPLAEIVRVLGKMPVEPRIEQTIPSVSSEIIRVLWKEPMETPEQKLAKQRYSARIARSTISSKATTEI